MKKTKVDPRNPPLKDIQGHTYQHEIGDPDWAEAQAEKIGRKRSVNATGSRELNDTPHAMAYQKLKAKAGRKSNVKIPRRKRSPR